jgi:hypothetical protein
MGVILVGMATIETAQWIDLKLRCRPFRRAA